MSRVVRHASGLFALILLALVAAACGGSGGGDDATATTGAETATSGSGGAADQRIVDMVPEQIRSDGTLKVATDGTFPPISFIEEGDDKVVGADPELITALAEVMGLEVDVSAVPFDSILPGLTTGKYEAAIAWMADRKDREEVVDFVTYARNGNSFFVNSDVDPATVTGIEDLCGLRVAVLKGSTQSLDAQEQKKQCDGDLEVLEYRTQNEVNLAVSSDRADVGTAGVPAAAYAIERSDGQLQLAVEAYGGWTPVGIAVPKESGLAEPLLEALGVLIDNGTYQEILTEWGAGGSVIDDPVINGAIS